MLTIPCQAAVCAARHIVAAHESACTGKPVDWGAPCAECSEAPQCRCEWMDVLDPIFHTAGIYPQLCRGGLDH